MVIYSKEKNRETRPAVDNNSVYFIDSMAYIFRSYYSIPLFHSPSGIPANGVYGFLRTLLKIIKETKAQYFVAVFDSGPQSFRNEIYPDYKANRDAPPEDLIPQFEYCVKIAKALGISTFKEDNFEADDLIATLTRFAVSRRKKAVVITGDKDLLQLVNDSVTVWDFAKSQYYEKIDVVKKMGVSPLQIPDLLGLAGDAADNIPGVPGIGPKTASVLLKSFTTVEGVLKNLHRLEELNVGGIKRIKALLQEHQASALLSKKIACLDDRVKIKMSMPGLRYNPPKKESLAPLLEELGFQKIKQEIPAKE